jgi:uncharacterized membrane protein SpoIIM required for sporulation
MNVGDFEAKNAARWLEAGRVIDALDAGKPVPGGETLPRRFRELCYDLSLAQYRMYGPRVVERLNDLVIRGYKVLYRRRGGGWESAVRFVGVTFPATVRREWRLFWLCNALFWLPFLAMIVSARFDISWVQAVLGAAGMAAMEKMYGGEGAQIAHFREKYGSNFMMFCHYIGNNVGIDFRIFAGGIAVCLGTVFYLLFNGLYLGAAVGYVHYACDPKSFWTFVSGHSSFELLGMVVAGMAGMRLGLAILHPGRLTRAKALAVAGKRALPLIYGAALMTGCAACIEGFWSARPLPADWKYGAGITLWALHAMYFLFVGRGVECGVPTGD